MREGTRLEEAGILDLTRHMILVQQVLCLGKYLASSSIWHRRVFGIQQVIFIQLEVCVIQLAYFSVNPQFFHENWHPARFGIQQVIFVQLKVFVTQLAVFLILPKYFPFNHQDLPFNQQYTAPPRTVLDYSLRPEVL
ncbi:hypothetical protein METBIDRAFT_113824 [Metschnikowia bicuspidata var. bicuspidata NRRL YB-4993]|uniref:Uncharacterized protein n=1 Tax=Metschnikowia bicuspidata var. bicuspidata NRRL YB-4993 TaxID=869754 RepID=A0A1A0HIK6_9ASCO|nr:hypothetical protein METBIDRAFT_113824 [Metschnikowia bicuspidata var. bicuspidata NRRL YB-4993]OBA23836.1 hypothetical protein METBIDRAFT_113824 [Metschnikowia bicuspidata var. bicuspidata NRRL YB-4993]